MAEVVWARLNVVVPPVLFSLHPPSLLRPLLSLRTAYPALFLLQTQLSDEIQGGLQYFSIDAGSGGGAGASGPTRPLPSSSFSFSFLPLSPYPLSLQVDLGVAVLVVSEETVVLASVSSLTTSSSLVSSSFSSLFSFLIVRNDLSEWSNRYSSGNRLVPSTCFGYAISVFDSDYSFSRWRWVWRRC